MNRRGIAISLRKEAGKLRDIASALTQSANEIEHVARRLDLRPIGQRRGELEELAFPLSYRLPDAVRSVGDSISRIVAEDMRLNPDILTNSTYNKRDYP